MGCHDNRRVEDLPLTWWSRATVGGALGSWPTALLGHLSGLRPGLSLSLCRGGPSSGPTSLHPSRATQGIFRALRDLLAGSWALAEEPGATEASYTGRGKSAGHSTRDLLPGGVSGSSWAHLEPSPVLLGRAGPGCSSSPMSWAAPSQGGLCRGLPPSYHPVLSEKG